MNFAVGHVVGDASIVLQLSESKIKLCDMQSDSTVKLQAEVAAVVKLWGWQLKNLSPGMALYCSSSNYRLLSSPASSALDPL